MQEEAVKMLSVLLIPLGQFKKE